MERRQSELLVITKAKDLCSYVMTVTQKSPKHFRYTFVSRLQNLTLSVIENLYRANDTYVRKGDMAGIEKRLELQRSPINNSNIGVRPALLPVTRCLPYGGPLQLSGAPEPWPYLSAEAGP